MTNNWRPPGVLPSTLGSDYQKKMWRQRYGESSSSPSMNYKQIAAADLWQKGIVSETQISEMLVEELAKLNTFEPSVRIDTPAFARMTLDQQIDVFRQLKDEVISAPSNKQEDAQRNFVQQLGSGAKNFGKGLLGIGENVWTGINAPFDAITPDWIKESWQNKITNPALKALSIGGEEAAAEWIYFTQKMIPGEQQFERRVEAWKKQQWGDKPKKWWQKLGKYWSPAYFAKEGFGEEGSEFYNPGFDVPMGVHLPLEILSDPLNFIGVGLIVKGSKFTKMGKTYAAGEEALKRAKTTKEVADYKAREVAVDGINRRALQDYRQDKWNVFIGAGTREVAEATLGATKTKLGVAYDDAAGYTDVGTRIDAVAGDLSSAASEDIPWDDILMGRGHRRFKTGPKKLDTPEDYRQRVLERQEARKRRALSGTESEDIPFLRGNPHAIRRTGRDPLADEDALYEIGNQQKADGSAWVEGDPDYLHPVNQAAMNAYWHGGIRPEELKNLKMTPFMAQLQMLNPSIPMAIGSTGKANNRRLFGGKRGNAYKFFENWIMKERRKWLTLELQEIIAKGVDIEDMTEDQLKAYNKALGKGELNALEDAFFLNVGGKNVPYTATAFNKMFEEAAEAYGEEGVKLLDFYRKWGKETPKGQLGKGNNNFAAVYRLNAASRWLENVRAGGGNRSTTEIQMSMGHDSPRHTSRYMSYLQMEHADLEEVFTGGGFLPDQLELGTKINENFLKQFPAGAKNQDARAQLISDRSKWLIDHIVGNLSVENANRNGGRLISLHVPEGATDQSAVLYTKLEELANFWEGVDDMIEEKRLIEAPFGGTAEQIQKAKTDVSILEAWRQSVVDAATELANQIVDGGDPIMTHAAINQIFSPFRKLARVVAKEQAVKQKFGSLARREPEFGLLSDVLPPDFIAGMTRVLKTEIHEESGREIKVATEKLDMSKASRIARLSQADIDKMNKQFAKKQEAIIPGTEGFKKPLVVKSGDPGLNWSKRDPNLLASKDARLGPRGYGDTASLDPHTGWLVVRQEDVYDTAAKRWKEDRRTYIVTEWMRHPDTNDVVGVKVRRLAQEPVKKLAEDQESKIRFARELYEEEIPVHEIHKWRLSSPDPISTNPASDMFDDLIKPGPKPLNAQQVADYYYLSKGFDSNWQTMGAIRQRMSAIRADRSAIDDGLDDLPAVPSAGRLISSGLLEKRPGTSGGGTQWRWIETADAPSVKSALDDLIAANPDSYGWAMVDEPVPELAAGRAGGMPPRGPGKSTRAGGGSKGGHWNFEEGYHRMSFGPNGEYGLEYVLKVPDAMQQPGRIFSGEGLGARFFKIGIDGGIGPSLPWVGKLRAPRGSQKWLRMAVPGTFGTSPGGRLTWTYRIARGQGQEAASAIKLKLEQTFAEAGILDDKFTGRNIQLRSESVMLHPQSKERKAMLDAFQQQEPRIWTKEARRRDEVNWTYEQNLKYVGTFLETPRKDLNIYYVMNPKLQRAWDEYHEVGKQLMNMFEDAGFKREDIMGDIKWKDEFVPLMTTSKMAHDPDFGPALAQSGVAPIGTKPTTFMERGYRNHLEGKMRQGRSLGYTNHDVYLNNPILALNRQVEQYYDYVVDERFMEAFASLGIKTTSKELPRHLFEDIIKPLRFAVTETEKQAVASRVTVNQEEALIRYFGVNWQATPMDELEVLVQRYRNMASSHEAHSKQQGLGFVVDDSVLKKMSFTEEDSRELMALGSDLINPVSKLLNKSSAFANAMRVFATGADLGVLFLHGLGSLMTMVSPTGLIDSPLAPKVPWEARKAWAKGAWNMGRSMMEQIAFGKGASQNLRREWYISTAIEREEMRRYGVSFFRSTFTEDLPSMAIQLPGTGQDFIRQRPGTFGKYARQARPGVERVKDAITSPIDGFGFFLDVSKTEMWRAYKDMGIDGADDLSDLAASLNAIHGTLNPNIAGIQQKQRVFESAFLLYAALYRRSAVALVKNVTSGMPEAAGKLIGGAARGDLEGGLRAAGMSMEARKFRRGPALHAVSGMVMSGIALGWAAKWMMDQGYFQDNPDIFDFGSPDFMSIKFGNIRMGVSTPFYTFVRMGNDIVEQMKDDPAGLLPLNIADNVVLKWARSQTSPVTSLGWDLLAGKDFIGNPLHSADSGWEVQAIGDRVARTLVPFWIESQFHKGRSIRGSLGEFMGLRVSPQSAYGRLLAAKNAALLLTEDPDIVNWRQSQERQGLPISVGATPRLLMARLMEQSPELQALEMELKEDVAARGTDERKEQDSFIEAVRENRLEANTMLAGIGEDFLVGQLSGTGLRNAVAMIETALRAANKQVAGDYKEVVARFDERRSERVNDPEAKHFVYDILYDAYRQEVTNDPTLHDVYGNFDVDKFLTLEAAFRKNINDEEAWQYIQDMKKQNRMLPGIVGEFYQAKDQLKEYWQLHERVFGKGSQAAEMINLWRSIPTEEGKKIFEQRYPQVKNLLRKLDYAQDRYRRANPAQDAMLVKFYDYTALTRAGMAVEQQRRLVAQMNPPRLG